MKKYKCLDNKYTNFSIEKYKYDIIDKVKQKRSELENYKAHGFDNQIKSMYEMIIGMINNSRSF